ncbi:DUF6233 domain-containing protein [Streptomyces dangxiongensis]|uniref:DUF6233 domain-containing protein n=1 Tax=Streptomyces dangxiongensis TaxID=1442032 RepID=UPI001F08D8B9|nr:DUF6233 domain-containing protein [Streptomyces dangxiongensis]
MESAAANRPRPRAQTCSHHHNSAQRAANKPWTRAAGAAVSSTAGLRYRRIRATPRAPSRQPGRRETRNRVAERRPGRAAPGRERREGGKPATRAPIGEAGRAGVDRRTQHRGRPPLQLHRGDCYTAGKRRRAVDREEARRLLADGTSACTHCRPDTGRSVTPAGTLGPGTGSGRRSPSPSGRPPKHLIRSRQQPAAASPASRAPPTRSATAAAPPFLPPALERVSLVGSSVDRMCLSD